MLEYDSEEILDENDILEGSCFQRDYPVFNYVPPDMTLPVRVASSYASLVRQPQKDYCTYLVPDLDIKPAFLAYRLTQYANERNFLNGHPLAALPIGVPLKFTDAHNNKLDGVLASIEPEIGRIVFKEPLRTMALMLDDLCVNPHTMYLNSILTEFAAATVSASPHSKELELFFSQKLEVQASSEFDDNSFLVNQGVAGSGKTTTLVEDILRRRSAMDIVVAGTNEALIEVCEKLVSKGVSAIHYTNDFKSSYSLQNAYESTAIYKDYILAKTKDMEIKRNKDAYKKARQAFKKSLFRSVILVTPMMARSLYTALNLRKDLVQIYVDEAGLMKVVEFLPVMLYNRKSTWLYGDYKQNKPFMPEDDLDITAIVKQRTEALLTNGLLEWCIDMKLPRKDNMHSQRLPLQEAGPFVNFFYNENKIDTSIAYQRVFHERIAVKVKEVNDMASVPKAIAAYRYMPHYKKVKEAAHLNAYLKAVNYDSYHIPPVFLCSHNYLKSAILEIFEKEGKKPPDVRVSYVAQSKTLLNTIVVLPRCPGLFVNDRVMLVSLSRHRLSVKAPLVSSKAFFNQKMIWYCLMRKICKPKWSYKHYQLGQKGRIKSANTVDLNVEWDHNALDAMFRSGLFDSLLMLSVFDHTRPMEATLWRSRNAHLESSLEAFRSGSPHIVYAKTPMYKWLALTIIPTYFSVQRRECSRADYWRSDLSWSNQAWGIKFIHPTAKKPGIPKKVPVKGPARGSSS